METQDVTAVPDELPIDQAAAKPRRAKLIVGVGALVVLLAGAAFVGGRLLNNQPVQPTGKGGLMIQGGPGGVGRRSLWKLNRPRNYRLHHQRREGYSQSERTTAST